MYKETFIIFLDKLYYCNLIDYIIVYLLSNISDSTLLARTGYKHKTQQ